MPSDVALPDWHPSALACPRCVATVDVANGAVTCRSCGIVGTVEQGIYRFSVRADDEATNWYVAKGGSDFRARMQIPFTMSSLDAAVYRSYLEKIRPASLDAVIADIGAADGRNTEPFLQWGYRRVIATDVSVASLARLRQRVAEEAPEQLDRLLLVECDARHLPLRSGATDVVISTEVLCCLNEDYLAGLASCARILKPGPDARLLISERTWEGALFNRLLYSGVAEMAALGDGRYLRDGATEPLLRTRSFTEEELAEQVRAAGLTILERKGTPLLSLLFGYLRGKDVIGADDAPHLQDVQALLTRLGDIGQARRTHAMVAYKAVA